MRIPCIKCLADKGLKRLRENVVMWKELTFEGDIICNSSVSISLTLDRYEKVELEDP